METDHLNQFALYEHPLHCNEKRETLHTREKESSKKEREKLNQKLFEGSQEVSRKKHRC